MRGKDGKDKRSKMNIYKNVVESDADEKFMNLLYLAGLSGREVEGTEQSTFHNRNGNPRLLFRQQFLTSQLILSYSN